MRKTVSKMSLEKLIYYYAVLNFIAHLPCCLFCRMLVNFFGVEYLRTVSKLKKEEEKHFSCVYNPIKVYKSGSFFLQYEGKEMYKKQDACVKFC